MEFEAVIGLEVHVQLACASKIFSPQKVAVNQQANSHANIIDLGFPGTLPVVNEKAIEYAVKFGLAVHAQINRYSVFDRKNYFYPDLAKGYQISQLEYPIVGRGYIDIALEDGSNKRIDITRAHLEEDAGKLIHDPHAGISLVDYNRAGTCLLEIVSDPVLSNAREASVYLRQINAIVRYLEISDGDLSQGSMRCDVNVSLRPKGETKLGTRAELKNINSYRFVEKAIDSEIARQITLLEQGEKIVQETRLYDAATNTTRSMRSKEEANDYRYFPCPDLLPVNISQEYIDTLQENLVELPEQKIARFIQDFDIEYTDAQTLTATKELAEFFDTTVALYTKNPRAIANWILVELGGLLHKNEVSILDAPIEARHIADIVAAIDAQQISGKIAKQLLVLLWQNPTKTVNALIQEQGVEQVNDDSFIEDLVKQVIHENTQQVEQYKDAEPAKQKKMLGFFVGQIMKISKGKANPKSINKILLSHLH